MLICLSLAEITEYKKVKRIKFQLQKDQLLDG